MLHSKSPSFAIILAASVFGISVSGVSAKTILLSDRDNGIADNQDLAGPSPLRPINGFEIDFAATLEALPTGESSNSFHQNLRDNYAVNDDVDVSLKFQLSESLKAPNTGAPMPFVSVAIGAPGETSVSRFFNASYDTTTSVMSISNTASASAGFSNMSISAASCGIEGGNVYDFVTVIDTGCATFEGGTYFEQIGTTTQVVLSSSSSLSSSFSLAPAAVPVPASIGFLTFGVLSLIGLRRRINR